MTVRHSPISAFGAPKKTSDWLQQPFSVRLFGETVIIFEIVWFCAGKPSPLLLDKSSEVIVVVAGE